MAPQLRAQLQGRRGALATPSTAPTTRFCSCSTRSTPLSRRRPNLISATSPGPRGSGHGPVDAAGHSAVHLPHGPPRPGLVDLVDRHRFATGDQRPGPACGGSSSRSGRSSLLHQRRARSTGSRWTGKTCAPALRDVRRLSRAYGQFLLEPGLGAYLEGAAGQLSAGSAATLPMMWGCRCRPGWARPGPATPTSTVGELPATGPVPARLAHAVVGPL